MVLMVLVVVVLVVEVMVVVMVVVLGGSGVCWGVRGSRRKESTNEIKEAVSLSRVGAVRGLQCEKCLPEPSRARVWGA
jgi:Flp pilus assembly protein TadB